MGKMSQLICARPKAAQKSEVAVAEKRVTTVADKQLVEASPEGRMRSQSDSVTAAVRMNEKKELAHLNNHLAGYFDRVHQLENENRQLQVHVNRVVEVVRTEHAQPTGINFEQEVQRIRDTLGKDKEMLLAEIAMLKPELELLKRRITELQQLNSGSEKARIAAEAAFGEMAAKLKALEDERAMWERQNMSIQAASQKLSQSRSEMEDLLAQERTARLTVDQRLVEVLQEFEQFKLEHNKVLEVRTREYVDKLASTREELAGQHQIQLQDALIKLRKEMEEEMIQSRKPLQEMYEKKLSVVTAELEIYRRNYNESALKLKQLDTESAAWKNEKGPLLDKIRLLEQDITKLQSELSATVAKYQPLLQQAEADKKRLERELQDLMKQYTDLMDAKVQLHNEIAAYRNLLENEELHMNQWGQQMKVKTVQQTITQKKYVAV